MNGRLGEGHVRQVARLVARLGLAGVWLRQPWPGPGPAEPGSPAALLPQLTEDAGRCPAGLVLDTDAAGVEPAQILAALAGPADSPGPRLALAGSAAGLARSRALLGARPVPVISQLGWPGPDRGGAAWAGLPGAEVGALFVPFAPGRDLGGAVAAAAAGAGTRPVWAEVAVSVGRTTAEAQARADREELFSVVGHPADGGLFGTLEECQASAARLAHAGATELICYLPQCSDLPDVLAQLRAIAIGAQVLRPGEPPSGPPPPPVGWGGRRPA